MRRYAAAVALFVLAALIPGVAAASAKIDAADAATALLGVWRVIEGSNAHPRTLVLRSVARMEDDAAILDGLYGASNSAKPKKVTVTVTLDEARLRVDFVTPAGWRVEARAVSPGELRGTFSKETRTSNVAFVRDSVTASEAFPPPEKITVIYVRGGST
jgi:hypothetical protein